MHLSLSYKKFRWYPLNISYVIAIATQLVASQLVATLSYVVSYLCTLSIQLANSWHKLISKFLVTCVYSQITEQMLLIGLAFFVSQVFLSVFVYIDMTRVIATLLHHTQLQLYSYTVESYRIQLANCKTNLNFTIFHAN